MRVDGIWSVIQEEVRATTGLGTPNAREQTPGGSYVIKEHCRSAEESTANQDGRAQQR
jgi:hypothetical protein